MGVEQLYYVPPWFQGYDIALQLLFGVITLVVSIYAFRLYGVARQRELKLFSGAFFFISLSYILWAVLNFSFISHISDSVNVVQFEEYRILTDSVFDLSSLGVYSHVFFFITGVITLLFMGLKVDKGQIYIFLISLILPVLFFSYNLRLTTYLIAAIMFAHISGRYVYDYMINSKGKSLSVLLAFVFLFLASLTFMYSGRNPFHYATGHLLTLGAYFLILVNFIRVLHYGQKKKQA